MNCLFQKALNDKVIVNRCVLDSVLWFHIECPKWAGKFDDPIEFKRKWRDFFSHNKSIADSTNTTNKTDLRMKKLYGYQSGYPEDVQMNKKVLKFADEFEKYSPQRHPMQEDEEDPEEDTGIDEDPDMRDVTYNKKVEAMQMKPISLLDSTAGVKSLFANASMNEFNAGNKDE